MKARSKQDKKDPAGKPASSEDEIREQLYDKNAVLIMQDFYGMLYGFLAKRVIDSFGEEGEQIGSAAEAVCSRDSVLVL